LFRLPKALSGPDARSAQWPTARRSSP